MDSKGHNGLPACSRSSKELMPVSYLPERESGFTCLSIQLEWVHRAGDTKSLKELSAMPHSSRKEEERLQKKRVLNDWADALWSYSALPSIVLWTELWFWIVIASENYGHTDERPQRPRIKCSTFTNILLKHHINKMKQQKNIVTQRKQLFAYAVDEYAYRTTCPNANFDSIQYSSETT